MNPIASPTAYHPSLRRKTSRVLVGFGSAAMPDHSPAQHRKSACLFRARPNPRPNPRPYPRPYPRPPPRFPRFPGRAPGVPGLVRARPSPAPFSTSDRFTRARPRPIRSFSS